MVVVVYVCECVCMFCEHVHVYVCLLFYIGEGGVCFMFCGIGSEACEGEW